MIKIQIGDSRRLIHGLKDKSIDCVVTSPPYWGLRDYKTPPIIFDGLSDCKHSWELTECGNADLRYRGKNSCVGNDKNPDVHEGDNVSNLCSLCGAWRGQLGLEPTPELFIKHLLDFFDNVKLKLKDEGNCFVNLGDTYAGSKVGNTNGIYADGIDEKKAYATTLSFKKEKGNLPAKCLCMVPQRFAWGMIEHGWILRNEIIWAKPNHMPESVTDRLTKSHEVIYHFVKQQKYYYDLDAIREPLSSSSIERITQKTVFDQTGGLKQDNLRGVPENGNASRCNKMVQSLAKKYQGKFEGDNNPESFGSPRARTQRKIDDSDSKWKNAKDVSQTNNQDYASLHRDGIGVYHPKGKNPGDVWYITTQPYPESHFATFPLELVRIPILAGCPIGGTVLDPFAGSGTVGEFCRHNDRNAILFELNPDYKKLIEDRAMLLVPGLSEWCLVKGDA